MDYEGVLERVRAIAERIKREYGATRVILYGSYADGTATEDSDIDLLIIAETDEGFFDRIASVKRLVRDLRNGLVIAPIVLTPGELESRKSINDTFISGILENGIDL